MLDSIYHMQLKILKNHLSSVKRPDFTIFYATFNLASLRNINKFVYYIPINLFIIYL